MAFKTIKSLKEIPISRNTLILCDIDDTIIAFDKLGKKWWRERFDDYFERNGDYEFSKQAVLKEWIHQIHKQKPVHVDEEGFTDFMERINLSDSTLVFITARHPDLFGLTSYHLKQLGINSTIDVHYTDETPKGDYIANVIDFEDFEHVIFIDDMEHNIQSVKRVFGDKVEVYLVCNT
jgi:hypothetical protein